jgi:hypothetical protein
MIRGLPTRAGADADETVIDNLKRSANQQRKD